MSGCSYVTNRQFGLGWGGCAGAVAGETYSGPRVLCGVGYCPFHLTHPALFLVAHDQPDLLHETDLDLTISIFTLSPTQVLIPRDSQEAGGSQPVDVCRGADSSSLHLGVTAQYDQSSDWLLSLIPLVWKRVIDSQAEKLKELDKEIRPFRQTWEEADSMKSSVESLQNRVTELESGDKGAGQAARNTGE